MNSNIIKTDTKIEVQKLTKSNHLSDKKELSTIATFNLGSNRGYIYQFSFVPTKEYNSLKVWKNAVKRIFDIEV